MASLQSVDAAYTLKRIVGKQTYILTIAPGVDAALLLAVCICLVRHISGFQLSAQRLIR